MYCIYDEVLQQVYQRLFNLSLNNEYLQIQNVNVPKN